MGVLQDFENRLEGAVEGFFARVFRSGLQPIELAKGVQRYAADNQHITADGVVVPNVYRVSLSTKDHERLSAFGTSLARELGEVLASTAAERGWQLRGPVKVRIEESSEIRVGRFRMTGRIETVDGQTPDERPHAPSHMFPSSSSVDAHADARQEIDHTQVITSPPASSEAIVIRSGEESGRSIPLSGTRLSIGRLATCDIPLPDSTVSREHAALVRRSEAWWIVDLGSTNGTRVNGALTAEQPVAVGDRIEFGDAAVELVEL